jgi:hypothetical protein
MKQLVFVFAAVSTVSGFVAAWFWYRSARIPAPDFERLGSFISNDGSTAPLNRWAETTAWYNRYAAALTAISVASAAVVTFLGML